MRVLTRKAGEAFIVGPNVKVTVLMARGDRVRLAVEAPQGMLVCREEVINELNTAARQALGPPQVPLMPTTLPVRNI
jgi:carbon storage regulator